MYKVNYNLERERERERERITSNDGNHGIVIISGPDVSVPIAVHGDLLLAVTDEVTVLSGRQSSLERLVKALFTHGEEPLLC